MLKISSLLKKILRTKPNISGVSKCGNNASIGNNVSFGGNVYLSKTAPISIGDHTMIAYNVSILTSTHNYNNHPMWIERIDRPVKIGRHVWIGASAIILPGVIIADYSVVGSGSVVTKNVPRGAIVAGNPAKIIKFRNLNQINQIIPIQDYPINSFITKKSYLEKFLEPNLL